MSVRDLLAGDVVKAAHGLLGYRLRSEIGGEIVEVVLNEVEAYGGADDPASHAYRGRTARNGAMFARPGTAYVYRSYGMHWCLNVAAGPEGTGGAVLLRGGLPVAGEDVIVRRRGRTTNLADGPGKLAQALGVTGSHDGADLLADGELSLVGAEALPGTIIATPRVGISQGQDRPWRFVVAQAVG